MIAPRLLIFPGAALAVGWLLGWMFSASPLPTGSGKSSEAPGGNLSQGLGMTAASASLPLRLRSAPGSSHVEPGSVAAALANPSALHRIAAFAPLVERFDIRQLAELFASLQQVQPEPPEEIFQLLLARWTQLDPAGAVQATQWTDFSLFVVRKWAERDPVAALARFDQFPEAHDIFQDWSRDRLSDLLTARPGERPLPGHLAPAEAMRRIFEAEKNGMSPVTVRSALAAILSRWAQADPETAWREAVALPSRDPAERENRARALGEMVKVLGLKDPAETARRIDAVPDAGERAGLQSDYLFALARNGRMDPARRYLETLPPGDARSGATIAAALGIGFREPWTAGALLEGLPPGVWRQPSKELADALQIMMQKEPERGLALLRARLPADAAPDPAENGVYQRMLGSLAGKHPKDAREFFLELPEAIGAPLLNEIARSAAWEDPIEAGQWAQALPESPTRERFFKEMAASLTRKGAAVVTDWLNTLPAGSGKAAAIEGFAGAIVSVSPEDALTWLRAVPTEADRLARLRRVWNQWADRKAARQWMEASQTLTAGERAALLKETAERAPAPR